jgi:hypothetical protein
MNSPHGSNVFISAISTRKNHTPQTITRYYYMTTRPSHNKQEIDRPGVDQQKSLRVAASTGHIARHALQGRASFSLVLREADRPAPPKASPPLPPLRWLCSASIIAHVTPARSAIETDAAAKHSLTHCSLQRRRLLSTAPSPTLSCPVSIPSSTRATRSSPRRHVRHPSYTIWPLP